MGRRGGRIGPINTPTATAVSGIFSLTDHQQALGSLAWPGPRLEVFMWGGGGAGGTAGGWSYGAAGGAGGAAYALLKMPTGTLYVTVGGGGGVNSSTNATGGGGKATRSGTDNRYGSGGGGYSGIFTASPDSQAGAVLIAGGGGGGGSSRAGTGNVGGAGGGSSGEDGTSPYDGKTAYRGRGGTQLAAGTNASCDSAASSDGFQGALLGGTCLVNSYGGAGGGGYWGGSAGGYSESNTMGGGGGGSGYYDPSSAITATLYAGSGTTPGNSSHEYRGTAGNAGAVGTAGSAGKVVIKYFGSQIATGGTVTSSGGYTIHTFTSSGSFILTNVPDSGNGEGLLFSQSVSTVANDVTNNSMTNHTLNITNQGTADGDWLNYNHGTSTSNFAFHTGHQAGWWPAYAAVLVVANNSATPRVLNQIRWKAHTNAIGNCNIWGSNKIIDSNNFTSTSNYTFLGRVHFGGYGGGGSDGTVKTVSFNSAGYGYRWYMIEMADNNSTLLSYPTTGRRDGWAMYGLTFDCV